LEINFSDNNSADFLGRVIKIKPSLDIINADLLYQ
jgi:hypothetical protein